MNTILNSNITMYEKGNRILVGIALLASVMLGDMVPVWFALIAIYPIITAIIAWDPMYAAFCATVLKARSFAASLHRSHKIPLAEKLAG